eukprot:scaffold414046_cov17-Prasinocladus_malaysianus.AAC.1
MHPSLHPFIRQSIHVSIHSLIQSFPSCIVDSFETARKTFSRALARDCLGCYVYQASSVRCKRFVIQPRILRNMSIANANGIAHT